MVIAMVGVWRMRRWGVYTFVGLCILGEAALIGMGGHWNFIAILLRCVVAGIMFAYFGRMI
jgi:hypothetical protein